MTYIMVDVEADGPIPGDYSMVWFGAIVVEATLDRTFYGRLKPISDKWLPKALQVCGLTREETLHVDDPEVVMQRFPGHVGRWLARREKRANAQISGPFSRLQTCQSRKEYEAVLGKPIHTISGKGCGTLGPGWSVFADQDLIEHYECGDCSIDLYFKDDRIHERIGYVRPTPLHVEFRLQESGR